VRRADAERDFEPRGLAVDGDDRLGAGQSRAEHAAQAHAAEPQDPNGIMSQCDRHRSRPIPVDHEVGVAEPGARDAHQQLNGLRRREGDFLDR
jgi:hypothetical protein